MFQIGQKVKFELAKNSIYPRWNLLHDQGGSGKFEIGKVKENNLNNDRFNVYIEKYNYCWWFSYNMLGKPGTPVVYGKRLKIRKPKKYLYIKLSKNIKNIGEKGDVFMAARPNPDDFATVNLWKDKNRKDIYKCVSWLEVEIITKSTYYRKSKR